MTSHHLLKLIIELEILMKLSRDFNLFRISGPGDIENKNDYICTYAYEVHFLLMATRHFPGHPTSCRALTLRPERSQARLSVVSGGPRFGPGQGVTPDKIGRVYETSCRESCGEMLVKSYRIRAEFVRRSCSLQQKVGRTLKSSRRCLDIGLAMPHAELQSVLEL